MSATVVATQPNDEECARAIGVAAGHFLRLKRSLDSDSSYGSAAGLLTYSRYDKRVLELIITRICKSMGIMLTKGHKKDKVEAVQRSIQEAIKDCEIRDPGHDYAYFFYRGALSQMGGAA